ncbi:MAG: DUF1565 domain-containing protein [Oscillatoria sp. SIO1A7]|nr:DUF1565 domain-containing protein [Oscillatoria sp. SIO1A7]
MNFKPAKIVLVTTLGVSAAMALTVSAMAPFKAQALQVQEREQSQNSGERGNAIALQQNILEVNPSRGNFRTITEALAQAGPGTIVQLAPGSYGAGETFPLKLKPGVTLKGNDNQQGQGVVISGGGRHSSRTFARQNVTIVAGDRSQIVGVTVTNPETRGTGIWVEDVSTTISNSTFANSAREGIFVTGSGSAQIENNKFVNNRANGISIVSRATGQIQGNLFEQTGFGISVGGSAAPVIANNQIRRNKSGVVATDQSRPVLQGNSIQNNRDYGVVGLSEARPSVATSNTFGGNGRQDTLLVNGNSAGSSTAARPAPAPAPAPSPNPGRVSTASPASASSGATFSCLQTDNDYATVAQRGKATLPQPMIVWTRTAGQYTPQQRCNTVTRRLNSLVANNDGSLQGLLFTVGALNNERVVCLTEDISSGCNSSNILFTLSANNASNAEEVLQSLIAFTVVGSGDSVFESADDDEPEQPYVDLGELDRKLQPELGLWFAQ